MTGTETAAAPHAGSGACPERLATAPPPHYTDGLGASVEHKILVVEDHESLAEAIGAVLTADGYEVVHTKSGIEALVLAARDDFELVLLDLQVEELAGGGVMRVISDLAIRTPVFAMSAKPSGWQKEAFRHGATACLHKPFNRLRLLELIEAFRCSGTREIWPGDVRQLSPDDLGTLACMSHTDLDALPFGAIRLDAERRVDRFNSFESTASTFFPPAVLGAKFSEIAPCSAVREFAEAIEDGFAHANMDRVLRFVFPHHGVRAVVSVRVYYDTATSKLWLFVSKARGELATDLSDAALGDSLPPSLP